MVQNCAFWEGHKLLLAGSLWDRCSRTDHLSSIVGEAVGVDYLLIEWDRSKWAETWKCCFKIALVEVCTGQYYDAMSFIGFHNNNVFVLP